MEFAMSQNKKIILLIVLPLLVSCVLICVLAVFALPRAMTNVVATDSLRAKQIGAQIAEYTLPPGYREDAGADWFAMQMVMIVSKEKRGLTITLNQFKTMAVSREQMEAQNRQVYRNLYGNANMPLHYVGERTVTIKGKPTVLTILETTEGVATRQVSGVFQGKGGTTTIMVLGYSDNWNWQMLDDFFQSIR
jgi:hypothetical protein